MLDVQRHFKERVVRVERRYDALSNRVFLVETEKGKFILKERGPGPELLLCRVLGLPRVLSVHEDAFVQEYIEHRKADLDRDWAEVALGLRKFHGTRVSPDLRDQRDLMRSLWTGDAPARVLGRLQSVVGDLLEMPPGLPRCFGLCHNDPQPGNILMTAREGTEAVFIDFEHSSTGNQLADIAGLFCEAMCDYAESRIDSRRGWSRERKTAFLKRYFGDEDIDYGAVLDKVSDLETFSHFLWYLWGRRALKRRRGTGSFDYHVYARSRMGFLRGLLSESDFAVLERDLERLSSAAQDRDEESP